MLIALTDWMASITSGLTEQQMQDMLRSEHGGLNEIFADVASITGNKNIWNWHADSPIRHFLNPLSPVKTI